MNLTAHLLIGILLCHFSSHFAFHPEPTFRTRRVNVAPLRSTPSSPPIVDLISTITSTLRTTPPDVAISRSISASRALLTTLRSQDLSESNAPAFVATLFSELGGTYIKLGQVSLGGSGGGAMRRTMRFHMRMTALLFSPSYIIRGFQCVSNNHCAPLSPVAYFSHTTHTTPHTPHPTPHTTQFIASSPTLFPPEWITAMSTLLDSTPPTPFSSIEKTIRSEIGLSAFKSIDQKPIGSASIAQVHRATLKNNTDVVIKVMKPTVETGIITDLNFLLISSKILEVLLPDLKRSGVVAIVEDIRTATLDELDFRKEASKLSTFRTFLDTEGLTASVTAPLPYPDLSSKRCLVMEYIEGERMIDREEGGEEVRMDSYPSPLRTE